MADSDCISELPDEILCHILSSLPVADAFGSKLLSRRWSRLQVPFSNLYFNQETIFGTKYRYSAVENLKSEFVEKVDWFLSLCKGPCLNTFMVDFCLDNEFASAIDNWVSKAVSMEAKSIELEFYCTKPIPPSQMLYKFPFHLLPEPKTVTRLKHLKLSACLLLVKPQSSFNCLKTLELKNLPLDQTGLDSVLLSCLDLEWLTMDQCELPRTLRVSSARLRGLRVHHCLETRSIELNAAQLQAFEFRGRSLKLNFLLVPPLERVHFGFLNPYAAKPLFVILAEFVPKLQILSFSWFKAINIPAGIPEFSCLKQLDFFSTQYWEFDLLSITNVLNACPMLQKLRVDMNFVSIHSESGKKEKVVYSKNIKYLHLEEIEISGFRGTSNQTELVIYLLRSAVALKHMTLIYTRWKSHDYKWSNIERPLRPKLPSEKQIRDLFRKEMIRHGAELIIC